MTTASYSGDTAVHVDAPASNTDLWTVHLRSQVRTWLDPLGLQRPENIDIIARPLADMAAAAMSGWMSLIAGPAVRAMYSGNKAQVTEFIQEQAIDPDAIEIPVEYARPRSHFPAPTQLEEWAITTILDREPVSAR
jgi:hypothetical protein